MGRFFFCLTETSDVRNEFFDMCTNEQDRTSHEDMLRKMQEMFKGKGKIYTSLFFYVNDKGEPAMDFFDTPDYELAVAEVHKNTQEVKRIIKLHEGDQVEWIKPSNL